MIKKWTIPLALVACLLWASAFPTLKTLYELVDMGTGFGQKIYLAGIRFSIAGLGILLFYMAKNRRLPKLTQKSDYGHVMLLGLFQTGIMYALFYVAVYNTSGIKSAILSQGGIFIVVLLSPLFDAEDGWHFGKGAGLLLGLFGIIVVNLNQLGSGSLFTFNLLGEGLLLLSGFFSAMGTFMAKRLGKGIDPILLTGWQMGSGGIMLLLVGMILYPAGIDFHAPMARLLLMYSVIISSGAFTLWYVLLQYNKAGNLSMIRFTIPVMGTIMSALFLPGEHLTLAMVMGLILVALGIYLCNRPSSQ